MSLLKVENLHVYYGSIHAIKGISFDVNEGEVVTLIGANGAGKSTTMRTIMGLEKCMSGSITYQGQDITNKDTRSIVASKIILSPEGRQVFPKFSVMDNLLMGAYLCPNGDCLKKAIKSRALERAFEQTIPQDIYLRLEEEMRRGDG